MSRRSLLTSVCAYVIMATALSARGQGFGGGRGAAPRPEFIPEGYDDHQNMMDQLGIQALRPGKNGQNQNGPGFDEATANNWMPTMPDVMKMKDGTKVTTPQQWEKRRAEIVEDFEREVYGRIPSNVPKVTWEVTNTAEGESGGIATVTKTLVGHVDNSGFPQITVNIQASFTVPANATGPVPVMIEFGGAFGGGGGLGGARGAARGPATGPAAAPAGARAGFAGRGPATAPAGGRAGLAGRAGGRGFGGAAGPSWTQQAIAHGWGYGYINPGSIQADSGGNNLRQGIIGLTNKGQPRKPDDWGALRAWGWGVSRLVDYFEQNPDSHVNPKAVGIEGVSRYGKAALVTEAFDSRIAVALVASSGEGGAKLHRHDFGEAVENLTGTGEYHWMAGNFLKYGASEATFGSKNASDLPVDSHELIAMCAPRPCFISYGIPQPQTGAGIGDPAWVDAHGSFMATVLAGPAYRVLGKKDLGIPEDQYLTAKMPEIKQLVGGELAWRQHEGGHEATPQWPTFFEWAGNFIKAPPLPPQKQASN